MKETDFIQSRSKDWNRLAELSDRGFSIKSLNRKEFDELIVLYRRAAADLALARTQGSNHSIIVKLNDVVLRAYTLIYRRPKQTFLTAIGGALATIASSVRRQARFVAIAVSMFLFFAIFTGAYSFNNSGVMAILIPPGGMMDQNASAWEHGLGGRSASDSMMMTGLYASNNPMVTVMTAGLTVGTFGFGSIFMMYQNGAMMGALGAKMAQHGKLPFLLASIFPHGVPELSGMFIATAAGLALGWALIRPGNRSRAQALAEVGRDAVPMLGGAILLMWIAAPIEGWFSYNPRIPIPAKVAFGVVEVIFWTIFWMRCGKPTKVDLSTSLYEPQPTQ